MNKKQFKEVTLLITATALGLSAASAQNLLINGDFESGNTGFTTDYYYSPGNVWWQNWYDIAQSPFDCHIGGADFPDHTSGTGHMLVLNGGSDTSLDLWKETVTVSPNRTYAFSGWSATWGHNPDTTFDPNPPQLAVFINGVQQGGTIQPIAENGQWQKFTVFWNSQSATEAVIEVKDSNNAYTGNDPALDDLSFSDVLMSSAVYPSTEISWQSVPNGVYQLQWLNPNGYWYNLGSQVSAQGTTVSVWDRVQPGTRSYRVLHLTATQNLLENGDFEDGAIAFTTGYTENPASIWSEGTFAVVQSPSSVHPLGTDFTDHTSGTGLMLAINGNQDASKVPWSQSIAVQPNHRYSFSGWCASWGHDPGTTTDPNPAYLKFFVVTTQGTKQIGYAYVDAQNGQWKNFTTSWDSGSATQAEIQVLDNKAVQIGNDFALDDLSVIDLCVDAEVYPSTEISWQSVPNAVYQVQWASTPSSDVWNDLGSPLAAQETTVSVWDRVQPGTRYYRVLRL